MFRRGFLKSLFMGASGAALPGVAAATAAPVSNAQLATEIEALLRETESLWDAQDTSGLMALWDTDDPEPFYLAGEQDNWFVGRDALKKYLDPIGQPKVTQAIRVRFYDIRVRLLAADLAFAGYWMKTDMKLVFAPKPFGSDNRVASIFRRKPEGWRYVCYTEAFQAPNLYFQKLFEKDVSPDYQEFYDEVMKK